MAQKKRQTLYIIAIYTKIKDKMKLFHHSVQEVQDVVVVVVVADF